MLPISIFSPGCLIKFTQSLTLSYVAFGVHSQMVIFFSYGLVSATSVYREAECFDPSMVTGDVRDCLLTVIGNIDALEKELHRTGNLHSSQTTQRAFDINKVSTGRCSFVQNHFQIFLFELLNRPCQNNSDYYPIHMLQHQPFM